MNWTEQLSRILYFPLFEIGGQAITPFRLVALAILVGIILWIAHTVRRLCEERLLRHVDPGPRYTFARLAQYVVWVIGFMMAMEVLNFDLTAFTVVAGALGVGIGFGLQNIVANFVAGLVLLFERPIKVNDRVTVENIEGNVLEISFRSTTIVTNDNIAIIVPNSQFINGTVINWSHSDNRVRIHVPVGVAYGSDVELVRRTLLQVAAETEGVLASPEPEAWLVRFGDSSLDFELLAWTDQVHRHRRLVSRLNFAIDAAFRANEIQIPFPQRDLHVRSAEALSPLLPEPSAQ